MEDIKASTKALRDAWPGGPRKYRPYKDVEAPRLPIPDQQSLFEEANVTCCGEELLALWRCERGDGAKISGFLEFEEITPEGFMLEDCEIIAYVCPVCKKRFLPFDTVDVFNA